MNDRSKIHPRMGVYLLVPLAFVLFILPACHRQVTFQDNYDGAMKNIAKAKYPLAQIQLERAVRQDPESFEAQYQLAMVDLKLKDDVAAYTLLRAAEEHDRKSSVSIQIRVSLAKMFLAAKEYEQAHKRLVWVLQREPGNAAARGLLGTALAGMAQPEEAGHEADRVLEADPQNLQARVLKASLDLVAKDGAAAEAVLLDGVKLTNRSEDSVLALANFYQLVGRSAQAAALFQEVVTRDPKNIRARSNMAWLYARAGDRASAEKAFREMAEISPKDPVAVQALTNYYIGSGDWPHAIAELEAKIKKEPTAPLRESLAEVYYLAGRRADALKVAEQLIKENNQDVRARLLKGMMHVNQQQYDDAITEFTHVLYFQTDLVPAHYWLAIASMATNNEQVAVQHMERALQLNKSTLRARIWLINYNLDRGAKDAAFSLVRETPDAQQSDPELRLLRAICSPDGQLSAEQQVDFQQAILAQPTLVQTYAGKGLVPLLRQYGGPVREQLETVVKNNPTFRPAQTLLVKILEIEGKQMQALAQLEKRVAANPNSFPDLVALAKIQLRNGQVAAARVTLDKAGRVKSDAPDVLLGMSEVETLAGNLDRSRGYMEELTKRFPQSSEAWSRLAQVQDRRHAVKEAQADYEKSLELNPKNALAANNLAWLLASVDDLKRAIELAKKAHTLAPTNPNFADTLGWIQYRMGDYTGAVQTLGDASRRAPENPTMRYHLAMTQIHSGREKEALANLQYAIKLNPRMTEAPDILSQIATLRKSAH